MFLMTAVGVRRRRRFCAYGWCLSDREPDEGLENVPRVVDDDDDGQRSMWSTDGRDSGQAVALCMLHCN